MIVFSQSARKNDKLIGRIFLSCKDYLLVSLRMQSGKKKRKNTLNLRGNSVQGLDYMGDGITEGSIR